MFKFLTNKHPTQGSPASVSPAAASPNSTLQRSNVRRELVRVVLKDIMRLHGIPLAWLGCEVIIISRPQTEDELHIQLVVLKWKEPLLRYAPALGRQLLAGLDRFDPSVDHSKYVVSWRFAPDCGCPFTEMPKPEFWLKPDAAPVVMEPVSVLDRRATRRPPKVTKMTPATPPAPKKPQAPYSPTEIAPLR